nr:hypothetical protein [Tanacetum cinerariifolium]
EGFGKRYLRWVEAVMVSPEVENEKWRRFLLHQMRDTFGASTGGREEDSFTQNRMQWSCSFESSRIRRDLLGPSRLC